MRLLILIALLALSTVANADQAVFPKYGEAFRKVYWAELYPRSGTEFYCGKRYPAPVEGATPAGMTLEHAYPAQWIVEAMSCGADRAECNRNSTTFGFREADMHNLFPAWGRANSSRGDRLLGEVDGEDWRWPDCDFENKGGIVEPRKVARGNFARAIFYMHAEYDLSIDPTMLPVLLKWHRQDPVNQTERRRNDKINEMQHTRNPFIDDPDLVRETFPEEFE